MDSTTNLQQTQVLQTILDQLLYPTLLRLIFVLAERVSRLAARVVAEVEVGELGGLAQQRAELYDYRDGVSYLRNTQIKTLEVDGAGWHWR
jgi:hypothetical protein